MNNVNLFFILCISFLVVTLFIVTKKHKLVLLISSICVYFYFARYSVFIIFYLAIINYLFSNFVKEKKIKISIPVLLLLVPLLVNKLFLQTYSFTNTTSNFDANSLFNLLGLSFITFNSISYLFDVKRKYVAVETKFQNLLLYHFYFPILFSGPLVRYKNFIQTIEKAKFNSFQIKNGIYLILWGLFKNLVLSKRILLLINTFQGAEAKGLYLLLEGTLFFLYLYTNFSSFISFFQGVSLLFNIHLPDNFRNRVYLSHSREIFWKGWHITLNNWFRDYVFYELIKLDKQRKHLNFLLFITFICIALWHSISLPFLIWGFFNASWLILERKYKNKLLIFNKYHVLGIGYHLFFSSLLACIFISESLPLLINNLFASTHLNVSKFDFNIANIIVLVFCFMLSDTLERKCKELRFNEYLYTLTYPKRYFIIFVITLLILVFARTSSITNYYNVF